MKHWLMLAALICFGSPAAHADVGTYDVMNDSITINDVSISSYTAGTTALFTASLIGATTSFPTLMENRKVMEIQNVDSSNSAWCRISLSSTSANGDLSLVKPTSLSTTSGRKISAGSSWILDLPSRDNTGRVFIPWCVNDGGSGALKLTLTQGRSL